MPRNRPAPSRTSVAAATLLLLAAPVVLSGCSSSTASKAVAASTPSSATAAASTGITAASSPKNAITAAGGGGQAAGSGFCRQAALAQAAQTTAAGAMNVHSPAALQKIEQQGLAELHALAAGAPSAIKGDLAVLVAEDDKFYAALQAAHFDAGKMDRAVLAGLDNPEFTQATKAVGAYLTTQCGIKQPSA